MKSGDIMKHRGELFALAELWVVLLHMNRNFPCHLPVLGEVFWHGYVGVDMFLFLSGLGLCFSLEKNSVKQFYVNRVKRVLVPSVCLALAEALITCAVRKEFSFSYVVKYGTLLSYWIDVDTGVWYVSFIILLYALFPLIKRLDEQTKHVGTVLLALAAEAAVLVSSVCPLPLVEDYIMAVARIPVFLCGVLAYPAVKADKPRRPVPLLGALLLLTAALFMVYARFEGLKYTLSGALSVLVLYAYTALRSTTGIGRVTKWLAPIGAVSLEMYIVHLTVLRVWNGVPFLDALPWPAAWASIFAVSLALSVAVRRLFAGLWRRKTA